MDYPIFFKLPYEVRCRGIGVRVILSGRALMVFEDDEWWCHGVEPGGVTASGRGPGMAYMAFKDTVSGVLNDMAHEASDCDGFEMMVRVFLAEGDGVEAERWEKARLEIRSGQPVDWTFEKVRRETGDWPVGVAVQKLDQLATSDEDLALAQDKVA